ncbi:type II toxin-antitoxin system HigB family toxin, partial [Histophilus somni]
MNTGHERSQLQPQHQSAKTHYRDAMHQKAKYKNASVLKNRRVVFNIKGNEHRLIVAIAFKIEKICLIPFLKII